MYTTFKDVFSISLTKVFITDDEHGCSLENNGTIWINPNFIISIAQDRCTSTLVNMINNDVIRVKETPEEIFELMKGEE